MTQIWTMTEAQRQAAIDGGAESCCYGSEFDGQHIIDVYTAMRLHASQAVAAKFTEQVRENRAAAYDGII